MALPFDPIAEAERQWDAHFDGAPLAPMAAVTSVMRAHQLLLARLNELLEPWGITFPRYEALMLLYFCARAGCRWGRWATGCRCTARASRT